MDSARQSRNQGARLCLQDEPQHMRTASVRPTCCGWQGVLCAPRTWKGIAALKTARTERRALREIRVHRCPSVVENPVPFNVSPQLKALADRARPGRSGYDRTALCEFSDDTAVGFAVRKRLAIA